MKCVRFVKDLRGNLLGFADIEVESGIVIVEVTVHLQGTTTWANPPARPVIQGGRLVQDERGKVTHIPVLRFVNKEARDRWSAAVVAAVLAHPIGKGALEGR
jgi:hypothetical protein